MARAFFRTCREYSRNMGLQAWRGDSSTWDPESCPFYSSTSSIAVTRLEASPPGPSLPTAPSSVSKKPGLSIQMPTTRQW